jgi:ribosomal silencing factor RsfS
VRKILSVLPIDKYGHILTMLHQGDLSIATPTQILGKINAHEMYMHITPQEGPSSSKKKDLAFKASQDKRSKEKIAHDRSSDDEVDDASIALMVRRTAKMLKKLNKNGVKFDSKKKKFSQVVEGSPSPKWIAIIMENLVISLITAPNPRKTSTKRSTRARKMTQLMMTMKRR